MKNKWVKGTIFTALGLSLVGASAIGIRIATIQAKPQTSDIAETDNQISNEQQQPTTPPKKTITDELEYLYIGLISAASFIFMLLILLVAVQIRNRKVYLYFCNY